MRGVQLLSVNERRYGSFPSRHDRRDFSLPLRVRSVARPSYVNLEEWLGPVKDQGNLGACTGFGASGKLEFLFRKYKTPSELEVFSPLNIYWNERNIEGDVFTDAGASIRTACQVIVKLGACLESEDPYKPENYQIAPTEEQIADAEKHKAGAYHRLFDLGDMFSCIASGYPFLIGMVVYESFESIGPDGIMPMPSKGEYSLGGHCALAYGYDDATERIAVRNSWGTSWGKGGNFFMPYEFAADPSRLFDAFIAHLGNPWK